MYENIYRPDNKVLYESQNGWGPEEFDNINALLNKNFLYRDKIERKAQIYDYDLSRMEDTTKAIMKALLLYYGIYDEVLKEFKNLKALDKVKPLKQPLYLSKQPTMRIKEFIDLNIFV